MSSLEFHASGDLHADLKPVLEAYQAYNKSQAGEAIAALNQCFKSFDQAGVEVIPESSSDWVASVSLTGESFSLSIQGSTSIDHAVYQNVIEVLDALPIQNWQANFFESQTGYGQSWLFQDGEYFDTDIDFTDAYVLFAGEMQEDDLESMQEEAEECEVLVQEALDDQTEYLIVGEQVGQVLIDQAKAQGVKVLTEQQYLAVLEDGV